MGTLLSVLQRRLVHRHVSWVASASLVSVLAVGLASCARNEAATLAATPAPQVTVAEAISQGVTEFDQFTGRITPVEHVDIRPRVSGYIASVEFAEGREVQKDDVLFVIDPRPYEAESKRARAELARANAALTLAHTEHERAIKLLDLHAISQQEFDARVAGNQQAEADVAAAQAAVDAAALNLTFTRVRSPISGLISKAEVTAGNLVSSGETLLTSVVSMDPVYVEFQGDEQMYLKYGRSAHRLGTADKNAANKTVWVGLANETDYPHQGSMVFVDNELDPATGTVRVRGKLDNRQRLYTPGMFARVRISSGGEQPAVVIRDSAIGTDQTVRYVYVVDAQNKVEYRAVKLGPAVPSANGMRVIREGLQAGESIVVTGLQRVRAGTTVAPQKVAMQETAATLASTGDANKQGATAL